MLFPGALVRSSAAASLIRSSVQRHNDNRASLGKLFAEDFDEPIQMFLQENPLSFMPSGDSNGDIILRADADFADSGDYCQFSDRRKEFVMGWMQSKFDSVMKPVFASIHQEGGYEIEGENMGTKDVLGNRIIFIEGVLRYRPAANQAHPSSKRPFSDFEKSLFTDQACVTTMTTGKPLDKQKKEMINFPVHDSAHPEQEQRVMIRFQHSEPLKKPDPADELADFLPRLSVEIDNGNVSFPRVWIRNRQKQVVEECSELVL